MADDTNDVLYRLVAEGVPDAVVYADREGIIRLWSPGAERMFGFAAAEAVGQSLDLIIPENLRARHWEGYRRVMDTGTTRYGTKLLTAPALRADGSRLSTEFSMALVRDGAGDMAGSGAVIRDVTERWLKEKDMKERLAELERCCGADRPGR
ncbi:PAS domain S-box protein [Geobacter sulfurreducens subsp. ethanolicus]|uniref:PAS domain-containing protein n=1 Tax=Geobacter sulfurreducens TaxID=35554 RepID=UPI0025730B76|nr:PAS domain S-box protein [Geobacter sulfurreducens]BEH11669.1 PAS domain S-box protein [Geobacter sulfurreducens subsp. ethanolicus]